MKTYRILIEGADTRLNKGNAALLISLIKIIKKFIPNAKFTILANHPDIKLDNAKILKMEAVSPFSPYETFRWILLMLRVIIWRITKMGKLIEEERLKEYYKSDIILNTGGDPFVEGESLISNFKFMTLSSLLLGLSFNKPIVICAQSIKLNRIWNRLFAKYIFNRVRLITLRDEISLKHLQEIGVNKPPIYLTADLAFALEPAPYQRVKEILKKERIDEQSRPLVGVSASRLTSKISRKYLKNNAEIIAKIVDYLVDTFNTTVVFVPHVIGWGDNDDRIEAANIYKLIKSKNKIILIEEEYTPQELKGIIGQCDLFIGERMHANIAALSQCVPTIAIAYSPKFRGIMEMLGQERYVIDIKNLSYDKAISKINDAWGNREEIKKELEQKVPVMKKKALFNGKLIKDLLNS